MFSNRTHIESKIKQEIKYITKNLSFHKVEGGIRHT